jgi:hypothetical protein
MAVVKGILLFEDGVQSAGWSEVYYFDAGTLPNALAAMNLLAAQRTKILSREHTITHIRISNPVVPAAQGFIRGQRAATLVPIGLKGNAADAGEGPDVVWTGAMVRYMDNSQTIFRNQILRGVPDDWWSNGSDKVAKPAMNEFLPGWLRQLQAMTAYVLHFSRANNNKNPTPITIANYMKMTRRATGRPFVLLRGRR